jgi:hypothetical protein
MAYVMIALQYFPGETKNYRSMFSCRGLITGPAEYET